MREQVGRSLQISGMLILPVALFLGVAHGLVRLEVMLLGVGGFLFVAGWLLTREREG